MNRRRDSCDQVGRDHAGGMFARDIPAGDGPHDTGPLMSIALAGQMAITLLGSSGALWLVNRRR
jgi:hypothetical protein